MESYVVSARKYRPHSFDTVVGQSHVTRTLLNEIKNQHLAQAFLFNGPRGVGKTTCARILAKEINKDSVEDKTYDFSYNIFELDAASNNSVEDIRLLNEQVRIPPQVGKYKVYIIDEVHMLSPAAFNAFLKTLEEPPPYAIFILATTERHKILPTILSRCQVFNFNRITVADSVKHLQEIAEKESIEVEPQALHIIAQKADGALRDALSMFDQMASIGEGKITYEDVIENLSVLNYEYYFKLTDAFVNQDIAAVMILFDEILEKGFDGQIFLNGLSSHFRDIMVMRDERTLHLLEVPQHIAPKYLEAAQKLDQAFLVNAINIANKYDQDYKGSRNQRLHVELALVKICYLKSVIYPAEKKNLEIKLPSIPAPRKDEVVEASPAKEAVATAAKAPVEEENVVAEPPSVKLKPIDHVPDANVAKLGDLDSLLISTPKVEKVEQEQEVEVEEKAEVYGESFDLEKVEKAMMAFADELLSNDQNRLHSIFKFIRTELDGMTVLIHLNKQHKIQMEDIRVDLLLHLRKHLSNSKVLLDWVILKNKTKGPRAYTDQEKFEEMAKKNDQLNTLKDVFNLKVD